jgi:hypothetical protein
MSDLATDLPPAADVADAGAVADNAPPAPKTYDPNEPVDVEDFYRDDKPKEAPKADDAPNEGEEQQEGEEGEEPPEPIAAPLSWAKDYKDKFEALPREMQEVIAGRENERDIFVRRKSQEFEDNRKAFEGQARSALQTVMENHRVQLQQYAQQIEAPQPDLRLLNSDDPSERSLYFQQEAAYRQFVAQREELTQHAQQAEHYAQVIAEQQRAADLETEHAMLNESLGTEWSDPSSRANLLETLQPIAAELGYPAELIANARGVDIIAMKHVATLKAKADKYDALQKAKMVPVRAAKGAIPPTARTGSPSGRQAEQDTAAQLYPDDVRRN